MVLKITGADFSAKNIGQIEIDIEISDFVLASIALSGRTMTTAQQKALQVFNNELTTAGIWSKINKLYMPFLGADVTKSFVNYKTNTQDSTPSTSEAQLVNGGIKIINSTTEMITMPSSCVIPNVVTDMNNCTIMMMNTEDIDFSQNISHILDFSNNYDNSNATYFELETNVTASKLLVRVYQFNSGALKELSYTGNLDLANAPSGKQLFGVSCNGTTINAVYGGSNSNSDSVSANISYASSAEGEMCFGYLTKKSKPTNLAMGAGIIASYLTVAEMQTVQTSMMKLAAKFITV